MSTDLTITHLILNASPVVQFVIALLMFASVSSWSMIFDRMRILKRAGRAADEFEGRFWSGGDLAELYRQIERETDDESGMASIFRAGFREFARLRTKGHKDPMAMVQGAQRSMRVSLNREVDRLEHHLTTLATIGSTSPYVGLFGTVWGIMNSFTALGNVKQATLALVAPGIAEALIATAIGLFAAIPAVVAYNRYSNDVERLNNR
ncbi:MAG: protein TolQ, partial [Candidatus Thiodiazotropha sp. (ex Lucinoma borealis)]|nr:protein TolQ [Candidatus Thiodiazotropha sp. (ex Lucinoma borealis)]